MGIVGNLVGQLTELPVICFVVNADSGGGWVAGHKWQSVLSLDCMCFWDEFIVSRVCSGAVNGEFGAI